MIGYDPALFIEPAAESRELEELTCVICSCVVRGPLNIPCGDLFCGACLTTAYSTRRCCPSCKTPFHLSECHVNRNAVKKVWGCKVRCPKYAQGCKAEYVIGMDDRNVRAHAAVCEYVDVTCDFCGEVMPKHRLDGHVNDNVGLHMRQMKERLSDMDSVMKGMRESQRRSDAQIELMVRQRNDMKTHTEGLINEARRYAKQQAKERIKATQQHMTERHNQLLSAINRLTLPLHATTNFYQYTFTAVDTDNQQQWESPRFVIAGREYMMRLVRSGEGEEQTLRLEITHWGRVYDTVKDSLRISELMEEKLESKDDEKKDALEEVSDPTAARRGVSVIERPRVGRARDGREREAERLRERERQMEIAREREREDVRQRQLVHEREQEEVQLHARYVRLTEAERARNRETQRERERERMVDWDRQQQQRRVQQREEPPASRQQQQRVEYALESFRDFAADARELMDTSLASTTTVPAVVGGAAGAAVASQSLPAMAPSRRRRSVRFSLDAPTDRVDRVEHIDLAAVSQSAAAIQSSDMDGTFDSFSMRTWQPATTPVQSRAVVRFFVYDRPGRVSHYAAASVSALPTVIYTSNALLNVSSDLIGGCVSTSAVPLADSEGDGMRRGWMHSEWKSVSAAVMIDDAVDNTHNGLQYTAADYLYATLRHRTHGAKEESDVEAEVALGGQLYTGEDEEEGLDGMMAAAVGETSASSLPVPVKRRRVDG